MSRLYAQTSTRSTRSSHVRLRCLHRFRSPHRHRLWKKRCHPACELKSHPHNPVNVNALNQKRPPCAGAASIIYLMSWCRRDDGRRRNEERGRVLRGERHPVHDPADEHVNDVGLQRTVRRHGVDHGLVRVFRIRDGVILDDLQQIRVRVARDDLLDSSKPSCNLFHGS